MECGSSNLIGPQNLIGNGTIRRCDFDGMSMALLEEVYLCEAFFDVSLCSRYHLGSQFTSCFLKDVRPSAPALCLPRCHHSPLHDDNG